MNKLIQNIFLLLFPFYPFWAWLSISISNKPIDLFVTIGLIPITIYFLVHKKKRLPKYLVLFIIFTLYHLSSIFLNNTFPLDTNKIYFLLTDPNILACILFIIIEHIVFDKEFINRMSKFIFIIVIISLFVSIIQIKLPTFFTNSTDDENIYVEQNRIFSIYSWISLNSLGISFPILISILLSVYSRKKFTLPLLIISGIIVSFLTRARYVMISVLVVFSQLFFNAKTSIFKKASIILIFYALLLLINFAANKSGYDINEVINNRILEKDTDMSSAGARITSYYVFLQVFPDNPWFGIGPETKQNVLDLLDGVAPEIHVGYLSYLYFYGIIGCSILFLSIYFLLRDAWIVGKRDNFWGSFYGLVSFCIANFTFVYFNFSEMGIVLSLIYLRYYKNRASLQMIKIL